MHCPMVEAPLGSISCGVNHISPNPKIQWLLGSHGSSSLLRSQAQHTHHTATTKEQCAINAASAETRRREGCSAVLTSPVTPSHTVTLKPVCATCYVPLYHLESITVITSTNISTHLMVSQKKTEPKKRKTVDERTEKDSPLKEIWEIKLLMSNFKLW